LLTFFFSTIVSFYSVFSSLLLSPCQRTYAPPSAYAKVGCRLYRQLHVDNQGIEPQKKAPALSFFIPVYLL